MREFGLQQLQTLLWAGLLAIGFLTTAPLTAEEFDFTDIGEVRTPGAIPPDAFLNQFVFLDVEETGHYRLWMDKPGALLLHAFETEDRRPREGVAPRRLRQEGSPTPRLSSGTAGSRPAPSPSPPRS